MTAITVKQIHNAMNESEQQEFRKPVIVLSSFWMRWLCERMDIEYCKKIDTGSIIYVEQEKLICINS